MASLPVWINDSSVLPCIVGMGQSWMSGGNCDPADVLATPEPEHPGVSLMLSTGPHPPAKKLITGLVDLHEVRPDKHCETPMSGCANGFQQIMRARIGREIPTLFTAAGRGGTLIRGKDDLWSLDERSETYARGLSLIETAARFVRERGKRLAVVAAVVAHGETDAGSGTDPDVFVKRWCAVRRALEADVAAITGQMEAVSMFMYQTTWINGHERRDAPERAVYFQNAQLTLGSVDPRAMCVGPVYHAVEPECENGHVSNRSKRRIGLQFGAYTAATLLGGALRPLALTEVARESDNVLRLTYSQPLAIEHDDRLMETAALGPGSGYVVLGDGRQQYRPKTCVDPNRSDTLVLTFDAPLPSVGTLQVGDGQVGSHVGRDRGIRTGVRSATPLICDPQDGYPLYDWACIQSVPLPSFPPSP